jgi:hypothetical protein
VTTALWLLVFAVLLSTAWALTHLSLLLGVLTSSELDGKDKAIALVPFLTPWKAWVIGRKIGVVCWAVFLLAYLGLRVAA